MLRGAGASAIDLKRGLDRASRAAFESLRAQSRPVQSRDEPTLFAVGQPRETFIGALMVALGIPAWFLIRHSGRAVT